MHLFLNGNRSKILDFACKVIFMGGFSSCRSIIFPFYFVVMLIDMNILVDIKTPEQTFRTAVAMFKAILDARILNIYT